MLNFADLALGADVEVPAIGSRVKINVKPGTQAGEVLRLKGKGIRDINGYGVGDQLIYVNVYTPRNLTAEEREILSRLKTAPNFQPKEENDGKGFFAKMKDIFN